MQRFSLETLSRRYGRRIAFLLALFFATQEAMAAPVTTLVPEERTPAASLEFELPAALGRVETILPGQGPALIHILTAHGNYEAQKSIQAILHHLRERYGFRQLFLEGSAGPIDASLIRFFPDRPDITMGILDALTRDALVKGPELFLAEAPEVEAVGMEDLEAYKKNVRLFQDVLVEQQTAGAMLEKMNRQIEHLTAIWLNRHLRDYLKQLERFEAGKMPVDAWIQYLFLQAEKLMGRNFPDIEHQLNWPMLVRLRRLQQMEKKIDPAGLENEKNAFLSLLEALPPVLKARMAQWLEEPIHSTPLSDSGAGQFFEEITEQLPDDFDYSDYPNTTLKIGIHILQSELDALRLGNEVERLADLLAAELTVDETQRELLNILKDYRLLQRLLALELVPSDFDKVLERQTVLTPENLIQRFKLLNQEGRVRDVDFPDAAPGRRLFDKAIDFYRGTRVRDTAMLERIWNQRQTGTPSVVITGGFHSGPFEDYFRERAISYVRITPNIQQIEGRQAYVRTLLENQLGTRAASETTVETVSFAGLDRESLIEHGVADPEIQVFLPFLIKSYEGFLSAGLPDVTAFDQELDSSRFREVDIRHQLNEDGRDGFLVEFKRPDVKSSRQFWIEGKPVSVTQVVQKETLGLSNQMIAMPERPEARRKQELDAGPFLQDLRQTKAGAAQSMAEWIRQSKAHEREAVRQMKHEIGLELPDESRAALLKKLEQLVPLVPELEWRHLMAPAIALLQSAPPKEIFDALAGFLKTAWEMSPPSRPHLEAAMKSYVFQEDSPLQDSVVQFYGDAETVMQELPELSQIVRRPDSIARFLTLLSLWRTMYSFDEINREAMTSLAYAESTRAGVPRRFLLNDMKVAPVTESFRRHLVYRKEGRNVKAALELKIPGEQIYRDLVKKRDFEIAWERHQQGKAVAVPAFYVKVPQKGFSVYMYGRKITYPEGDFGFGAFFYEDSKRLRNLTRDNVLRNSWFLVRAAQRGMTARSLLDQTMEDMLGMVSEFYDDGYFLSADGAWDAHSENLRLLARDGSLQYASDFGSVRRMDEKEQAVTSAELVWEHEVRDKVGFFMGLLPEHLILGRLDAGSAAARIANEMREIVQAAEIHGDRKRLDRELAALVRRELLDDAGTPEIARMGKGQPRKPSRRQQEPRFERPEARGEVLGPAPEEFQVFNQKVRRGLQVYLDDIKRYHIPSQMERMTVMTALRTFPDDFRGMLDETPEAQNALTSPMLLAVLNRISAFRRHPDQMRRFEEDLRARLNAGQREFHFAVIGPGLWQEPVELIARFHRTLRISDIPAHDAKFNLTVFDRNDEIGINQLALAGEIYYSPEDVEEFEKAGLLRFETFEQTDRGYRVRPDRLKNIQVEFVDLQNDAELELNERQRERFDFIFMNHVAEHLSRLQDVRNRDPYVLQLFTFLEGMMRQGGMLLVADKSSIKGFNWLYLPDSMQGRRGKTYKHFFRTGEFRKTDPLAEEGRPEARQTPFDQEERDLLAGFLVSRYGAENIKITPSIIGRQDFTAIFYGHPEMNPVDPPSVYVEVRVPHRQVHDESLWLERLAREMTARFPQYETKPDNPYYAVIYSPGHDLRQTRLAFRLARREQPVKLVGERLRAVNGKKTAAIFPEIVEVLQLADEAPAVERPEARVLDFSFQEEPQNPWKYDFLEGHKSGHAVPHEGDPDHFIPIYMRVIEHVLREEDTFLKDALQNLWPNEFQDQMDLSDFRKKVNLVEIEYLNSGGLKHAFLIRMHMPSRKLPYTFSIKPTKVTNNEEDQNDIWHSLYQWKRFPEDYYRDVARYGANVTFYFRRSTVVEPSPYTSFDYRSTLIAQEYVPGPTLEEIMRDESIPAHVRRQAVRNAIEFWRQLRGKVALTDPKSGNLVALDENFTRWKVIDLDKLLGRHTYRGELTGPVTDELYLEFIGDYYSAEIVESIRDPSIVPVQSRGRGYGDFSINIAGIPQEPLPKIIQASQGEAIHVYLNIDTDTRLADPAVQIQSRLYAETSSGTWAPGPLMTLYDIFPNGSYRFGIRLPDDYQGHFTF